MDDHICPACGVIAPSAGRCEVDDAELEPRGVDPLPGQVVGSYRVVKLIGAGGMGRVYLAVQPTIGARVAIKVLTEPARDGRRVERFFAEARAVNRVRHEHIVDVLDLGRLPGDAPYIVMEFVEGTPLSALLRERGPLPIGSFARLVREVLEAIGAAHEKGILHRDLKPENIMVTPAEHPKILDFGVAKLLEDEARLTRSDAFVGTPLYAAPEQALGEGDARSDLYAVGGILFEGLTGTPTFAGRSLPALLRMHADEAPPSPRALRPELPAALEGVILRALAKRPRDRFASAREMAAALAAATHDLPAGAFEPLHAAIAAARSSSEVAVRAVGFTRTARETATPTELPTPAPAAGGAAAPGGAPRPRAARRWVGAAMAIGAIAVAGGLAAVRAIMTTAAPGRTITTITDAPTPATPSPAAAAAYRAALQAHRDASITAAAIGFEAAVAADPSMASAHLWLVSVGSTNQEIRRQHFAVARKLRAHLDEVDRLLLDAWEPELREPPEPRETERRLAAAVAAHPTNVRLLSELAASREELGDYPGAIAAIDRALELDPAFAGALWQRANVQGELGDAEGARRSADRCVEVSPAAASCLRVRAELRSLVGDCTGAEAEARRMMAIEPGGHRPFEYLARALAARGASHEAVMATLERKWASQPRYELPSVRPIDTYRAAALAGDFEGAARALPELERALREVDEERPHAVAALMASDVYDEMGEPARAADALEALWKRRAALQPEISPYAYIVVDDPMPTLVARLVRAKRLSAASGDEAQRAWRRRWESIAPPWQVGFLWYPGDAKTALTKEEAERALAALPASAAVFPPLAETLDPSGPLLVRAGRFSEAAAKLTKLTRSCAALDQPFEHTRAHYDLGRALEATGDVEGACRAYAVVRARWGAARPRSITGERAAEAMARAGCR